jgi:DNA-binding response OmpR family regulator
MTKKGGKPRLLVVEDEPALAKVLQMRLQIDGFEVEIAGDGAEAMTMIAKRRPDLVVCDLMMPVMDGIEVTRAIKGDPKLKTIPILILTALRSAKEMAQLEQLGADALLNKPYDGKELTARIRELLGQASA